MATTSIKRYLRFPNAVLPGILATHGWLEIPTAPLVFLMDVASVCAMSNDCYGSYGVFITVIHKLPRILIQSLQDTRDTILSCLSDSIV